MTTTHTPSKSNLVQLSLSAIGVVFGDIGTSPLYAVKEIFGDHLHIDTFHVLGVLSLIFWSLTLVVAIKYATFIMRANNKGEGGVMALMALALHGSENQPRRKKIILTLGLFGAALFYGDGIITPAISVLGAVEGLQIMAPSLDHYIVPITVIVLFALFILQAKGSGEVGKLFSPIMIFWFLTLGVLGIINIIKSPGVLAAVNPMYAVMLLKELGWTGLLIMGSVVLALTGAEALYADMGHFGLKPIRYAWFGFVFPALLLNYFGQGALLLEHPDAIKNPFYLLAPHWAMYPMLILATLASVIASQAVISGAFSVTRQAIQLGYCPRMEIRHTSGKEMGQVYLPTVNWILMVCVFVVVVSFKTSSALASAYGIAVTGTMITTTLLAFVVIQKLWQWKTSTSIIFLAIFLTIDFSFLIANCLKIPTGGWLPLVIGLVLFLIMTTWIQGRAQLTRHMDDNRVLFEDLEEKIASHRAVTTDGTAIYLAKNLHGIPNVFIHNFEHNHVLHDQIIVLTVVIKDVPYVDAGQRIKIRNFGTTRNFYRVKFYYGFQESPDVRQDLDLCIQSGIKLDFSDTSFFIASEQISFKRRNPMPKWRKALFLYLYNNASSAIDFFKIPEERVIELGIRIRL
jgi:KUP system potassium uptake protein